MISGSTILRKYIAWYDFRILYPEKVCCLVRFQDPLSWKSILPGMISGSSAVSKYIAWYDFRILCHKTVNCLVCFQNHVTSLSWPRILPQASFFSPTKTNFWNLQACRGGRRRGLGSCRRRFVSLKNKKNWNLQAGRGLGSCLRRLFDFRNTHFLFL